MIYLPQHCLAIALGLKTQTRRLKQPGDMLEMRDGVNCVVQYTTGYPRGRVKWRVGQDYAVQPGRGKPGLWWRQNVRVTDGVDLIEPPTHISTTMLVLDGYSPLRPKLLDIREEVVQAISPDDAQSEGYPAEYDERIKEQLTVPSPVYWYANLWDSINRKPGTRWADNPIVWVLTSERVTGAK
jgi:hypothetical protein